MKTTTAQKFGSSGKSFKSPSAAAAVIGAALLASGTTDTAETAWSPAAACLLPDVLPVAGTLLSYGGSRQLAAGGTVSHSGSLSIGANALTCGAITASGNVGIGGASLTPPLNIQAASSGALGIDIYGRVSNNASLINFYTNAGASQSYISSDSANGLSFAQVSNLAMHFYTNNVERLTIAAAGAITASGAIQETPKQSSLNPTTTDIPSGKRMGWYNSTLSEFRDWVNIGGTLYKSAAYT